MNILQPILSIIILTWNNQEQIKKAIYSCLTNYTHEYEIIIVNNGSTDDTKKIVYYAAEKIKNIRIINNIKNYGPGAGRNIGVKHASGEYLMFLDGDDWLEGEAISIIIETIKKKSPDLIMFNHQRVWPDGKVQQNIPNKYVKLDLTNKDLTKPEDRKLGIQNIHCCWNKVYKKSFIDKNTISFPDGIYEDLLWSITASIKAKTFFYIGQPLYNYRQRANSITKSITEDHFTFFNQVELIHIKSKNETEFNTYKNDIKLYLKNQAMGIIKSGTRIPESKKKEFIKQIKILEEKLFI